MRGIWIDKSAMGLSGLCLVHCLAGAVLLSAASGLGGFLSHDIHAVGLMVAMPLALVGLWRGTMRHRRWYVPVLGLAGITLMAAALLQGHGQMREIVMTLAGVSLLAAAHLFNLRLQA